MTQMSSAAVRAAADAAALDDRLFWLSRLDDDLPKAAIVPDFKRAAGRGRSAEAVRFEIDAAFVLSLRAAEPSRGLSNVEICLALLAIVMSRRSRDDRLMVGLALGDSAAPTVAPFILPCARGQSLADLLGAVAAECAAVSAHASRGVDDLPRILGLDGAADRSPLFDIVLSVAGGAAPMPIEGIAVDVALHFEPIEGRLVGHIHYAAGLFERASIERLARQFVTAARRACSASRLRDIDVVDGDERHLVVHGFNSTDASFELGTTFHALFERQVAASPEAVAVIHRDRRLSYAELNRRANRVAHALLERGLGRGEFVGILLHRGCELVAAILGVFKAGGAYVPLDPTYPTERVGYMLDDSQARFLITDGANAAAYREVIAAAPKLRTVVSLAGIAPDGAAEDVGQAQLEGLPDRNPGLELAGSDRAYMIYTSGSTGRPKGAICRHDGALNHLFGELAGVGVGGPFNFLQTAASSSDISVWQLTAPLLHGGATVIADYEAVVDPPQLLDLMRRHEVTVAEPVPVVLRALIDLLAELPAAERALPALRVMMCTGEALPGELVDRWLALYPAIPVANTYGPTETSDDVTLHLMREPVAARFAVAPIGRPLANVRILILDRELEPVAIGVPGEICVAGIAVGEGYWQQPDKTAAAFVACPFREVAGGPMYRTGDLARWLADGSIEFLGRIDQQVKVRGFRIEPGEIEGVLTQHPAVQDAAVVAVADAQGSRKLVGYYVARNGQAVDSAELRRHLKTRLAEHMVPATLLPLNALPQTPLGKVDRRALARRELPQAAAGARTAPRDAIEALVAGAWAGALGHHDFGIHDNFFEIGGDSILTIHVVAELRRAGHAVAPRALFRHPTIAELASQLARHHDEAAPPAAAGGQPDWDAARWRSQLAALFPQVEDVYPLSASQRGIYFQSLLVPRTSGAYIEQVAFDLEGDLDEAAFAEAWGRTVGGNASLRTAIVRRGAPYPLAVVVAAAAAAPSIADWRDCSPGEQQARLRTATDEDRMRGFDPKRPPLTRIALFRLADRRWRVLWSYHHLILDGWSEPLVLADLFGHYDTVLGMPAAARPQAPAYRDLVAALERVGADEGRAYWQAQLAGFTAPVRVADPSPAVTPPTANEISHAWEQTQLAAAEHELLTHSARRSALTLGTIIHGAWALMLHRRTAAADLVFGSVASGRQWPLPGIEALRGMVAATQPLRSRIAAEATVAAWLRLLQLQMAEMRELEHVSLAQILQWCEVPAERRPLFDTLVTIGNYSGSDLSRFHPVGIRVSNVASYTQPLFGLTLFATLEPTTMLRVVYDRRRYAADTALAMLGEVKALMLAFAENPERRIGSLLEAAPA